jgi:hypothetical protein
MNCDYPLAHKSGHTEGRMCSEVAWMAKTIKPLVRNLKIFSSQSLKLRVKKKLEEKTYF